MGIDELGSAKTSERPNNTNQRPPDSFSKVSADTLAILDNLLPLFRGMTHLQKYDFPRNSCIQTSVSGCKQVSVLGQTAEVS